MRLLIHTGGTIGMVSGPCGLIPGVGCVETAVAGRARVVAFDPLLDSANVGAAHWNRMLDLIEAEDGPVLITHGTDTMTYTAAALSGALQGWPHAVILTGAMTPLGMGGDAEANLELALQADPGPGVWLAFAGKILPADGLVKTQSRLPDAFRARSQGGMGTAADVQDAPLAPLGSWQLRRFGARRVGVLTASPGVVPEAFAAALAHLDGAVLRVFGTGTIPASPELVDVLSRAVAEGKLLRAVSTCENGGLVPGTYAAGQGLWDAGVQNGGADTVEAALVHLWLALSQDA